MHQHRLATEVHLIAKLPSSQTEVDVLKAVAKLLVQPAELVPHRAAHEHHCAGHCLQAAGTARGRVIAGQPGVEMAQEAVGPDHDAGMLDRAGRATAAGRRRFRPAGAPPHIASSAASRPGNGRTSLLSRITYWPRAAVAPALHAAEKPRPWEGRTTVTWSAYALSPAASPAPDPSSTTMISVSGRC